MKTLSAFAKSKLTQTLVLFAKNRNIEEALLQIELVFDYEHLPAYKKQKKKETVSHWRKNLYPEEIPHGEHCEKMKALFSDGAQFDRMELVKRLRILYSVGYTAVEKDGGYMQFLRRNGYIEPVEKEGVRVYQLGENATIG